MKQFGMTLIEILIALFILSVGVVVLVKFQGDLLRNLSGTEQQVEAISIAENKLDSLRNYSYLTTAEGTPSYEGIVAGSSDSTSNGTTYHLVWTVTTNADPAYKTVTATVTWTDSSNTDRSVVLQTIIGQVNPAKSGEVMQGL